jgi:predicted O-linked N-acetylglucosamine transferase (SPINDLY family)
MWMGVPVITLAGDTHVSRVGVSLLNAVGLSDLIATTYEEYVHLAVELSGNPERLKSIRGELRDRMMRSSLGDVNRFAKMVAGVYRELALK